MARTLSGSGKSHCFYCFPILIVTRGAGLGTHRNFRFGIGGFPASTHTQMHQLESTSWTQLPRMCGASQSDPWGAYPGDDCTAGTDPVRRRGFPGGWVWTWGCTTSTEPVTVHTWTAHLGHCHTTGTELIAAEMGLSWRLQLVLQPPHQCGLPFTHGEPLHLDLSNTVPPFNHTLIALTSGHPWHTLTRPLASQSKPPKIH